ncbi:MAG TPA: hypothetical protein VHR45_11145 [Thermoanaerobaculia bacterium]|nr:hypothetical protein [Thermoanaerobaculia bacterium]
MPTTRSTTRRRSLDLLDELLPPDPAAATPAPAPVAPPPRAAVARRAAATAPPPIAATPEPPAPVPSRAPRRAERFTVNLPLNLVERARDAVFHTPGLTLAALTAEALTGAIERRERQRGEPFPARQGRLRVGRPVR